MNRILQNCLRLIANQPSTASLSRLTPPVFHRVPFPSVQKSANLQTLTCLNVSRPFERTLPISKQHSGQILSQISSRNGSPLYRSILLSDPRLIIVRHYFAKDSKVKYLDYRYKFHTRIGLNMLIIKRQKMKKHKRVKWRRKFRNLIQKKRLKREIAKEKTFRVELLSMIKEAEQFDPREYALRKLAEANTRPIVMSREEKMEAFKQLIRTHRYQTDYVKPKHRKVDA